MRWNQFLKMKRVILLAFVLGCVLSVNTSRVQAGQPCNLTTLNGGYGTTLQVFGGDGEAAAIGHWIFDGAGKVSGSYLFNATSGCCTKGTFKGTYKVRADCTGSFSLDFGRYYVVIVQRGEEFFSILSHTTDASILKGKKQ